MKWTLVFRDYIASMLLGLRGLRTQGLGAEIIARNGVSRMSKQLENKIYIGVV